MRTLALGFGTVAVIALRGIANDAVSLWSPMWWAWIVATVLIAGATGWCACLDWLSKHDLVTMLDTRSDRVFYVTNGDRTKRLDRDILVQLLQ